VAGARQIARTARRVDRLETVQVRSAAEMPVVTPFARVDRFTNAVAEVGVLSGLINGKPQLVRTLAVSAGRPGPAVGGP